MWAGLSCFLSSGDGYVGELLELQQWCEYTNNEKVEKEIKETIPFTIAMKRIKYLGIYLPKETKDLYIVNYKTLLLLLLRSVSRVRLCVTP